MEQKLDFCTTPDGVRICYTASGDGPPLVKAANWLSHLEYDWQSPVWRHWWAALSEGNRLVRYDERGCGLSQWSPEDVSFNGWISDLETVVDTAGLERFALLGVSKGGPLAIEYAFRHPERVSHLILFGAFSRGWAHRGQKVVEEMQALVTLTKQGWGRNDPTYRQIFTSRFMPGASGEQMEWFNELQRMSTSPEYAAMCQVESGKIDVVDRLPRVATPTLVFHARDDQFVSFDDGRMISQLIPNATFVPLESSNHLLLEYEPAWPLFLDEIRRFIGSGPYSGDSVPTRTAQTSDNAPPVPDDLTPREMDILLLLARGKTNREIAEDLVITANTVANHVKSILSKTNNANRTEAAVYARDRHLL